MDADISIINSQDVSKSRISDFSNAERSSINACCAVNALSCHNSKDWTQTSTKLNSRCRSRLENVRKQNKL